MPTIYYSRPAFKFGDESSHISPALIGKRAHCTVFTQNPATPATPATPVHGMALLTKHEVDLGPYTNLDQLFRAQVVEGQVYDGTSHPGRNVDLADNDRYTIERLWVVLYPDLYVVAEDYTRGFWQCLIDDQIPGPDRLSFREQPAPYFILPLRLPVTAIGSIVPSTLSTPEIGRYGSQLSSILNSRSGETGFLSNVRHRRLQAIGEDQPSSLRNNAEEGSSRIWDLVDWDAKRGMTPERDFRLVGASVWAKAILARVVDAVDRFWRAEETLLNVWREFAPYLEPTHLLPLVTTKGARRAGSTLDVCAFVGDAVLRLVASVAAARASLQDGAVPGAFGKTYAKFITNEFFSSSMIATKTYHHIQVQQLNLHRLIPTIGPSQPEDYAGLQEMEWDAIRTRHSLVQKVIMKDKKFADTGEAYLGFLVRNLGVFDVDVGVEILSRLGIAFEGWQSGGLRLTPLVGLGWTSGMLESFKDIRDYQKEVRYVFEDNTKLQLVFAHTFPNAHQAFPLPARDAADTPQARRAIWAQEAQMFMYSGRAILRILLASHVVREAGPGLTEGDLTAIWRQTVEPVSFVSNIFKDSKLGRRLEHRMLMLGETERLTDDAQHKRRVKFVTLFLGAVFYDKACKRPEDHVQSVFDLIFGRVLSEISFS